jgi:hypothetical protein
VKANHRPHVCDDRCTCPVHDTPLIYSPTQDDHACQDVTCKHGHGILLEIPSGLPSGPFSPILPVPVDDDGNGEWPQPRKWNYPVC